MLKAPPPLFLGWRDVTQVVLATSEICPRRRRLSPPSPASKQHNACIHVHVRGESPCLSLPSVSDQPLHVTVTHHVSADTRAFGYPVIRKRTRFWTWPGRRTEPRTDRRAKQENSKREGGIKGRRSRRKAGREREKNQEPSLRFHGHEQRCACACKGIVVTATGSHSP